MDIIQATYNWENFKSLLDKNIQYIYNYQDSNIINQIAIEFIKILLQNNVVNLKFNNNDIIEFIQYFNSNIICKEFTNNFSDNILINEFNSNIINDINNFSNCIKEIISNIQYNINSNNMISKFLYNLVNINSYKSKNLIDKTKININNNNQYNKNFKLKLNRNLNELQRIILDNMSIIHDSLNPNLYFKNKLTITRYNSLPKANKTLVKPIIPNLVKINNQISKYNNIGPPLEDNVIIDLDDIKANEYKLWYGHNSNIFKENYVGKSGKNLYKNKLSSNKDSQLKIRINNIFRIFPNIPLISNNTKNISLYSDNAKFNLKNKNYVNYIINPENFRSKSPGKDISHTKSSEFTKRKYKDDNNSLNIKEINISLYRKFSA
jgi:hypothetical protein